MSARVKEEPNPFIAPEDPPAPEYDYDRADASFAKKPERGTKAKAYEKKVRGLLAGLSRAAVAQPVTVADGAALLMHGPQVSEKAGDLAAHDPRIARAIDMLTEGAENPYLSLLAVSLPLVLQVLRNHETEVDPTIREWKIPFTKRTIRLKLKLRLGKRLRNLTNDPEALNVHVFTDPDIAAFFAKDNIYVAWSPNGRRA